MSFYISLFVLFATLFDLYEVYAQEKEEENDQNASEVLKALKEEGFITDDDTLRKAFDKIIEPIRTQAKAKDLPLISDEAKISERLMTIHLKVKKDKQFAEAISDAYTLLYQIDPDSIGQYDRVKKYLIIIEELYYCFCKKSGSLIAPSSKEVNQVPNRVPQAPSNDAP